MVKIAIVGSTGRVGTRVVEELTKQTAAFTGDDEIQWLALGRRTTNEQAIVPAAQYRSVDLLQPDTLTSALEGIDRLLLITPDDDLPSVQIQMDGNLLRAAKAAGVQHVIKVSAYLAGNHPKPVSFGIAQRECELLLENSGLTFTHLRPTVFMQTISRCVDGQMLIAPAKTGKVAFVDIADIARVATHILVKGGYENQVLNLTGPSAHSFTEVAAMLSSHSTDKSKNITHVAPPCWLARFILPFKAGVSFNFANRLVDLMASLDEGSETHVHDTVEKVTGQAPLSLQDHIAQHWRDYCPSSSPDLEATERSST